MKTVTGVGAVRTLAGATLIAGATFGASATLGAAALALAGAPGDLLAQERGVGGSGFGEAFEAPRRVALTFDDLPANVFRPNTGAYEAVTAGLVGSLARLGVPAIGFVNEAKLYEGGRRVPERVATLRAWIEAGLELGNHSFSHPDLHGTPLDEFQRDVLRGEEVTRALLAETGRELRYFRHPFLHTGRSLEVKHAFEAFLAQHGYRVAPVTIDNQEWIYARAYDHALAREDGATARRIADAYLAYMDAVFAYYEGQSRLLLGYEPPQVLLLHANRLNADYLEGLVGMIASRGYRFVTLDEALRDPAYALPDAFVGPGGITWLHRWAITSGEHVDAFAGEPEADAFVRQVFESPPP